MLAWIEAQVVEALYLSSITVAELRFGLALLPEGKRRTLLQDRSERDVLRTFAGRALAFDLAASQAYAALMTKAKSRGQAISKDDGYIAATAAVHDLVVATRDVMPFQAAALSIINPWNE